MELNDIMLESLQKLIAKIPRPGVLLLCGSRDNKENLITIGWLQFGFLWQTPVITVYIRPSRYSYRLLQDHDEFTINVLPEKYNSALEFCGYNSGSYCNKFRECGLTKIPSRYINTSSLQEAELTIECKIMSREDITQENLLDIIQAKFYSDGDYHQIITAQILNTKEK